MSEELEFINQKLLVAAEYGLQAEVVLSALKEMKHNCSITPIMAINAGCQEWDI